MTNWELVLRGEDGRLIDDRAQAREAGAEELRIQCREPLREGVRVSFTMDLGGGDLVRGQARIAWTEVDAWGGHSAGARITRMSWKDKRKLRARGAAPRYNFEALAKKALWGCYWIVVVAGAHNVLFHQPDMRAALGASLPAGAAALLLGAALMIMFR